LRPTEICWHPLIKHPSAANGTPTRCLPVTYQSYRVVNRFVLVQSIFLNNAVDHIHLQSGYFLVLRSILSILSWCRIQRVKSGCTRLVASSGGNAGMAAAYAARILHIPLTLYVPQTTGQWMRDRLKAEVLDLCIHSNLTNLVQIS